MLTKRDDVITLARKGGVGVELGIAEGEFSHRVLRRNHFDHFYSIDMWAGDRGHDIKQYKRVVKRLMPYRAHNTILRMTFDEALDLFPDESLDFIYADGYAHTAQEGGTTLHKWYPKLKPYGVFAGDDYHEHFRDNVTAIDNFKDYYNVPINVINCRENTDAWSRYPTWWVYRVPEFGIEGKKVAVVGNSSHLFNQDYGKFIDSHDLVIRINRCTAFFKPKIHDHSHGSRTDVWAVWNLDEYENYEFIPRDFKNIIQMATWISSKRRDIKHYDIQSCFRLIDRLKHPNPSTGLMLLDYISQKQPASVSVFGFDWKKSPTWSDPTRENDKHINHDFEKERTLAMSYFGDQKGFRFY